MVVQYLHGIETIEVDDGIRPIQTVKSAIIGIIGTAPNADTDEWPINDPILVAGNPRQVVTLGSSGTLPSALNAMLKIAGCTIIVVRVEQGATQFQTYSNLIGNVAAKTGVHAFRKANTKLRLKPRLLLAPGHTGSIATDGIASVTVNTAGTGYVPDATPVTFVGGGGIGAEAKAVVNGTGGVQAIVVTKQGVGYQAAAKAATGKITFTVQPIAASKVTIAGTDVTFVSGSPTGAQVQLGADLAATLTALASYLNGASGAIAAATYTATSTALNITHDTPGAANNAFTVATNVVGATTSGATLSGGFDALAVSIGGSGTSAAATVTLGQAANPTVAELCALAPQLRAYVFADSAGTSYEEAIAYRGFFDTDRLRIIEGGFQLFDDIANAPVQVPAAPLFVAKQAWVDENKGFWHDASNYPIDGVIGVGRPIDFSYYDRNVEGQLLNMNDIAVTVHEDGFRVMGVRSPTSKALWKFGAVRRTADMIYESIEQAMREAVDKPISIGLFDWIEGSVNAYIRTLKTRGALLGGLCWLDRTLNTPDQLVQGIATFSFDLEPPAPLEHLIFQASRNPNYYEGFIETFLAQEAAA